MSVLSFWRGTAAKQALWRNALACGMAFLAATTVRSGRSGSAEAAAQESPPTKKSTATAPAAKAWIGPITGRVFNDVNRNGVWDAGDSGIAKVGVSDTLDLVLTDTDGKYTLPNPSGKAKLLFISLPSGYDKTARWYQPISQTSKAADFDFALTPADESKPFSFAQISDIHIGGSGTKELLTAALDEVARLKEPPAFILATGDLVNTGSTLTQYDDYTASVSSSKVKVFSVFGNHDANDKGSSNYRRYLGPDYYSFSYGDCHFLCLSCVHKTPEQARWVAKNLELVRGNKRLFIFQHYSPSEQEHKDFAGYGAMGVFSGHWHSQHTVRVGQTASYNTANLLFGGIDCSPAGFKLINVGPKEITTRMRWIADGKRLTVVTPANSVLVCQEDVPILVNAYETSAEVTTVRYEVKSDGKVIAMGKLTPEGEWNWKGTIAKADVPRGGYELSVTAVNDRGETSAASTTFTVMGMRRPPAAPREDWAQFGGGPARGSIGKTALKPPLGPVWTRNTGGTLDFASPVVKDQTVYIGVKDRRDFERNGVLALRASDGSQAWFAPTPAAVSHSVAVDANRVYACSHGGIVHAFNRASGSELWSRELGSPVQRWQYSGPLLAGDTLYAGTVAYFGAFKAADGTPLWNQTYGGDWISSNACPAIQGTTLLVPANWGTNSLRAVNAADGTKLWECKVSGLHGSPVVAGDAVVFTDYRGRIHCVDLATGATRWEKPLEGKSSACTPAVADGIVVAGGAGSIKGYDLKTGAEKWSRPIGTSPLKMVPYDNTFAAFVGSPTIAARIVYVPCGDGRLYALTLDKGEILWSMDFGAPILSAPCVTGNVLFLSAFDGNVYALSDMKGITARADAARQGSH